jgi:hypothetical protein
MEAALTARPRVRVKVPAEDCETYVLRESPTRVDKERSTRRRALKKYWKRLGELSRLRSPTRDGLLLKLGQAAS